jgi:thioredoxin-like negative regulator of GroEL
MEPLFEEHAKKNPGIKFIHIDVDEAAQGMKQELSDVRVVPTFKLYKEGKIVANFNGINVQMLEKWIETANKESAGEEEKSPTKEADVAPSEQVKTEDKKEEAKVELIEAKKEEQEEVKHEASDSGEKETEPPAKEENKNETNEEKPKADES